MQNLIPVKIGFLNAFTSSLILYSFKDIDQKLIPAYKRKPLGIEVIFCMGGYNKRSFAMNNCFNPETEEWKNLGLIPKSKSGAGAVFVGM